MKKNEKKTNEKMVVVRKNEAFRWLLQSEYGKRCAKNQSYSLRSFAEHLNINSSTLSQILNGKRSITDATKNKLASRLELSPRQWKEFIEESELDIEVQSKNNSHLEWPRQIDQFSIISDWHHNTILELTRLNDFVFCPKWISKRIGITVNEANFAIDRLKRLGLLREITNSKGIAELKLSEVDNSSPMNENLTTIAQKKSIKQLLEKAKVAVDKVDKSRRKNTAVTMAVRSKDVDTVKKKINSFLIEMNNYIKEPEDFDDVYTLGVHFFPMTQKKSFSNGE